MEKAYKTLASRATGRIVEKKSEFLSVAAPAVTEEEALAVLEEVRVAHRTATHNVYAYVLRKDARQRYSDDGEPAKTAGIPVLTVLSHSGVTDCIIVVTRYFGGTLLGTGGLVRAYTAAAKAALAAAEILTVRLCVRLDLWLEYPLYEPTERLLAAAKARVDEPQFTDKVAMSAVLPAGEEPPLLEQLSELSRGQMAVQVSDPFYIPF